MCAGLSTSEHTSFVLYVMPSFLSLHIRGNNHHNPGWRTASSAYKCQGRRSEMCCVEEEEAGVRERKRDGNRAIDSSPSYPYCLWAHVGWTCWTPTERPADKEEREAAVRMDISATGCIKRAGQTRTDVSDVSMHPEVSVIPSVYTQARYEIIKLSIEHKHLWPRCLQSSPGIRWSWVRKETCILLLLLWLLVNIPPAILSYISFHCTAMTSPAPFLLFKCIYIQMHI